MLELFFLDTSPPVRSWWNLIVNTQWCCEFSVHYKNIIVLMEYSRNLSFQFYCLVDNQVYFGICYIRLSMMPSKSRCFFCSRIENGQTSKNGRANCDRSTNLTQQCNTDHCPIKFTSLLNHCLLIFLINTHICQRKRIKISTWQQFEDSFFFYKNRHNIRKS